LPNGRLRDWIRAVDLRKPGKFHPAEPASTPVASDDQPQRIPVRFSKSKGKRVKVSFAKSKSPP